MRIDRLRLIDNDDSDVFAWDQRFFFSLLGDNELVISE